MEPTLLTFTPILKEKVWGGDRLRGLAGRDIAPGRRVGESWEVSDHAEDISVVAVGPNRGRTLRDLMRKDGDALLGEAARRAFGGRFPWLIKRIDAAQTLSVQVHPDDAWAAAHGLDDPGKTEAWYILHAEPGAVAYKGLRPGQTCESLRDLIERDRLEDALWCYPVKRHDFIHVPARTVHATGAGLVLFEIQQNSDTTFRLYDWGRRPGGKPRPLHVEQALDCLDTDGRDPERQPVETIAREPFLRERLVACDTFVVERWRLEQPQQMTRAAEMAVIAVVEGEGAATGGGLTLDLRPGAIFVMPACLTGWHIKPTKSLTLLRATLPPQ